MANEDHLNMLRQGVPVWNQWRAANPNVTPDLTKAHAWRKNYDGANFAGADLTEMNFGNASLIGADFTKKVLNAPLLAAGMDEPACGRVRCPPAS
jgi:uncharacterized protein YjbI with pentapeptide repeats